MNFRPEREDLDTEINLTPLIDVVFLLLIFFMVTTTFSKEAEIKLKLPEASSAEQTTDRDQSLLIQINEIGEYAVKGPNDESARSLTNSSAQTLQKVLRRSAKGLEQPIVVVRADRLTPHEAVIKAMDAARREGMLQIRFSTDSRQ